MNFKNEELKYLDEIDG